MMQFIFPCEPRLTREEGEDLVQCIELEHQRHELIKQGINPREGI